MIEGLLGLGLVGLAAVPRFSRDRKLALYRSVNNLGLVMVSSMESNGDTVVWLYEAENPSARPHDRRPNRYAGHVGKGRSGDRAMALFGAMRGAVHHIGQERLQRTLNRRQLEVLARAMRSA